MTIIGNFCINLGLTSENLLERFPQLDASNVTNGVIYDILQYRADVKRRTRKYPWTWRLLKEKMCSVFSIDPEKISDALFCSTVNDVKKNRDRLIQNSRSEDVVDYMNIPFQLVLSRETVNATATRPAVNENDGNGHVTMAPSRKRPCVSFCEEVQEEVHAKLAKEIQTLNERITILEAEKAELERCNVRLSHKNLQQSVQLRALQPNRVKQKLKRKEKSIVMWKERFLKLKKESQAKHVMKLEQKLKEVKKKARQNKSALQMNKKRQKETKEKLKLKVETQVREVSDRLTKELHDKHRDTRRLKESVSVLENNVEELNEKLHDEPKAKELRTKIDGKTYAPWVRESSYHLQSAGVSQRNVSETISNIMSGATGQQLSKSDLPSYTLQNVFTKEMKGLSRQQIKVGLSDEKDTTLKYDGTTKKLGHLVETQVATKSQTYLLGVNEQVSGKAASYAETIQSSFQKVQNTPVPAEHEVNLNILRNITNTMTDRCVTNAAVDKILEEEKGSNINQFKCAMHPLDSFAKFCCAELKVFEKEMNVENKKKTSAQYPFSHRGESFMQSLVRTATKIFHDTQYNCDLELVTYLKSENVVPQGQKDHTVLIPRYVGNRFHVLYLSSGCLFHYADKIKEFFSDIYRPKNDVQHAVNNALQLDDLLVAMRAMGIIGKVISAPWMRLVGENQNILAMNAKFEEAERNLKIWSEDASILLSELPPSIFDGIPVQKDLVLQSLVKTTDSNGATITLLQKLCGSILGVVQRQLQSQLPGGEFWEPSDLLKQQAESCESTNISGERVFAMADSEILRARGAKAGFIESKTLFKANKTGLWLKDMEESKKKEHIQLAMREGRKIMEEDKEHTRNVQRIIDAALKKSRHGLLQKEDKEREKYERYIEDLFKVGGLWLNEDDMTRNMKGLGKLKSVAAVKAQINVRTKLLNPGKKIVFAKKSVDELKDCLLELMATPVPMELQDLFQLICAPNQMLNMAFSHRWASDDSTKSVWYSGQFGEELVDEEFKLVYDDEDQVAYMTVEEVLVDILRGDLELLGIQD